MYRPIYVMIYWDNLSSNHNLAKPWVANNEIYFYIKYSERQLIRQVHVLLAYWFILIMTWPQPFDLSPDSREARHLPVEAPEGGLPYTSLYILLTVNLKSFNICFLLFLFPNE